MSLMISTVRQHNTTHAAFTTPSTSCRSLTPGVSVRRLAGKSVFACYLLYRLQKLYPNASIIFLDCKAFGRHVRVSKPGGVVYESDKEADFQAQCNCPTNYIIYDMDGPAVQFVPATNMNAGVIVLSSPNASHYGVFQREYTTTLAMRAWSWDEIDDTRKHIYASPALHDYKERFQFFGGVPRHVFNTKGTFESLRTAFLLGLPSPDAIYNLLRIQDYTQISIEKGARLLTFETDADARVIGLHWISDVIGQHAMERASRARQKRLTDLLWEMSGKPAVGETFSMAFESYSHLKLAEGGAFRRRPVGSPNEDRLVQPPSATATVYYDDCKEVSDQSYGRPTYKNAQSVDAVFQPNALFQMTVSSTKNVLLAGVTACLASLRQAGDIDFYIVVPSSVFGNVKFRVDLLPAGSALPARVKLWLLCVEVPRPKRKRDELEQEVKLGLVGEFGSAVDELLQTRIESELERMLRQPMKKRAKRWMRPAGFKSLGRFPAASPEVEVLELQTGEYIGQVL